MGEREREMDEGGVEVSPSSEQEKGHGHTLERKECKVHGQWVQYATATAI